MKDYYNILGIGKDASDEEIKKAFKKLSVKWHPDKHVNDNPEEQKKAEEMFKDINEAYQVLSDKNKRQKYDNPIDNDFDIYNMDPFMETPFARMHNIPKRGRDIIVKVILKPEDYYNRYKKIHYKRNIRCKECDGNGGKTHICPTCGGTGIVQEVHRDRNMMWVNQGTCNDCKGTGKIIEETCNHCHGTGFDTIEADFNIDMHNLSCDIPENVYAVSINGGHESSDPKGPNGRLAIRIIRDDGNYKFDGNDIYEKIQIPYYDMILGTSKDITLPNGKKITIDIPKNSKDGNTVISKNNGPNGGNYFVILSTYYPESNDFIIKKLKDIKKATEK